jgi:hypothetical protein
MASSPRPSPVRFRFAGLLGLTLTVLLAGCAGGGGASRSPSSSGSDFGSSSTERAARGTITELHVFTVPVALELNGKPGPDGIGVRLYATEGGRARGVLLKSGRLEILMYDGKLDPGAVASREPARSWTFDAGQLRQFEGESSLGVGYQLALDWQPARPKSQAVSVVVKYHPPRGEPLVSSVNAISLAAKWPTPPPAP